MKVLVTGSTGQLGYDVCRLLKSFEIPYHGISSRDVDITDKQGVSDCFETYRPDVVIHCAAYTAVDDAEKDEEQCFLVNSVGTEQIARACAEWQAKMLYVSTDYVFRGTGEEPYETSASTDPVNVYGRSKVAGEQAVQKWLSRYYIVRTSWMFGVNGKNFIDSILKKSEQNPDADIRVVKDQVGSPTYTQDLARFVIDLIRTERYGIYHVTNEGFCTWAELAAEALRLAGRTNRIIPVTSQEYVAPAPRPQNSRLSKKSLKEQGFSLLPDWKSSVRKYIQEREERKHASAENKL